MWVRNMIFKLQDDKKMSDGCLYMPNFLIIIGIRMQIIYILKVLCSKVAYNKMSLIMKCPPRSCQLPI